MDRAALDAAYNNGAAVANSAQIAAGWRTRSDRFRISNTRQLDLQYGNKERNRIDLFEAGETAPLLVFIHGGYWQMRDKETFSCMAEGPLAHGISVALVGYTLAPEIRLDEIVSEIRSALGFLNRKLFVSGWSAGGHLTAMVMDHPNVVGGLAVSGIYDLEPMRLCYINDKLKLDEDEARRNSPVAIPDPGKPLAIAYGKKELPEMQRQSEIFFAARKRATLLPLPGHDHFTILEELASPEGALTAALRTLMKG
ncbi:MAG TPA: alpha/beta hydrolase [Burkholderiales bacterium]